MRLYRVTTNGKDFQFMYDQVADNWEQTDDNEYRVQVVDEEGFAQLADEDTAIVSYEAL